MVIVVVINQVEDCDVEYIFFVNEDNFNVYGD